MGRRNSEQGDSLDLLLDTICNTFGGVLFLAMLICLLSSSPVRQQFDNPESAAQVKLAELDAIEHREQITAAHGAVTAKLASLGKVVGWNGSEALDRARQIAKLESDVELVINADLKVAALEAEANATRVALEQMQVDLGTLAARVAAHKKAADEQQAKRQVLLRLPSARETFKQQAVAFVKSGKLYAGIYPSEAFRFRADYRGSSHSMGKSILPGELPDSLGSAPLLTLEDAARALQAQGLLNLDRDTDYVMFAVWPDSHEAFLLLRNELIQQRIGYGLVLLEEGEAVEFGSSRGHEQ